MGKRAIPYLVQELQAETTSPPVEKILEQMGKEILLELIRAILNKNIPAPARKKVKRLIFKMHPIHELVFLLTHKDENISKVSERLLVGFGHISANVLAQILLSANDSLKILLLKILGKMGNKATIALPQVNKLRQTKNNSINRMAHWAKKRIENNLK